MLAAAHQAEVPQQRSQHREREGCWPQSHPLAAGSAALCCGALHPAAGLTPSSVLPHPGASTGVRGRWDQGGTQAQASAGVPLQSSSWERWRRSSCSTRRGRKREAQPGSKRVAVGSTGDGARKRQGGGGRAPAPCWLSAPHQIALSSACQHHFTAAASNLLAAPACCILGSRQHRAAPQKPPPIFQCK